MAYDPLLRRFPVPEGIPSAVTLPELHLLQRYAFEAGTVLEIGTHLGFTCIGMALAGAHVTSVDPHNEGPEGASTWEPFLANVARHHIRIGVGIEPWQGPIEIAPLTYLARLRPYGGEAKWGLVFIDGDHVAPAPWRDAEIAMAHLEENGWIAFHDVTPRWPDVWEAAKRLEASGWRKLEQVGTLAVFTKWPPADYQK